MYKNIFSFYPNISNSLRGRAAQLSINKELMRHNYEAAISDVGRKYEHFLKLNKLTKLPIYLYPKQAKRLMEVI